MERLSNFPISPSQRIGLHWQANIVRSRGYDDNEGCLILMPYSLAYSGMRWGGSAEITIDFRGHEKTTALESEAYCSAKCTAADNTTRIDAWRDPHLMQSIRKLDCNEALFEQLKYRYKFAIVPSRIRYFYLEPVIPNWLTTILHPFYQVSRISIF